MGIRTIIVILLIVLAAYLIRSRLRRGKPRPADSADKAMSPDNLVQCEYCRTYIPRTSAVQKDGGYYCANGHRAD
ncbi:MAG: hypothetical protein FD165_2434 [Gammaproteobacteria bacterium]|nr:MAG: hypothetical protein FD165_2434 [Gammaproteobacteria bacterium]TND03652.1 MAG: hypothetical protein FD120_1808 [Gammaproteobacteria bacterium]